MGSETAPSDAPSTELFERPDRDSQSGSTAVEVMPVVAVNAQELLSQAIAAGVGPEIMDRLVTMRKEVTEERARAAFNRDLAQFQRECPPIPKAKQGVRAKYAPLEAILTAVKEKLDECGFSFTFKTAPGEDGKTLVTCEARHREGHVEATSWPVKVERIMTADGRDAMSEQHRDASAVSYGRRYTFMNAFGIQRKLDSR